MDIWNSYLNGHNGRKKIEYIKNNMLKTHHKSYDEIRTHVLETPETKEYATSQVIANLPRNKINLKV